MWINCNGRKERTWNKKIEDLESAIDNLDTVINTLKQYKQFEQDAKDLDIYKGALEYDLDELKQQYEELNEEEQKEAKKENMELEKQYWKEAM